MKIAVVTPYHRESADILSRCLASVNSQTWHNTKHILVSDGGHGLLYDRPNIEHLALGCCHDDAGATPRAIGALSAFSRGYDAVAFLDADNTFQPRHIEKMIGTMVESKAEIVAATRNVCDTTGKLLYVDRIESTGQDFCDTNCMFIGKAAMHILTYWVTETASALWSDRLFWQAIKQHDIKIAHCLAPTVNYHSRWAWHYQHAGIAIPDDSVWIATDKLGRLVHQSHKP